MPVILRPRSSFSSDDRMQFSSSQPDYAAGGWEAMLLISQADGQVSFSQPTKPEHMLLGSQLLGTPGASQVIHILSTASVCIGLSHMRNLTMCVNLLPESEILTGSSTFFIFLLLANSFVMNLQI